MKECAEEDTNKEAANNHNDQVAIDADEKLENGVTDNANGTADDSSETKPIASDCNDKTTTDEQQPPPAKKPRIFGAFTNAKIETVKENLQEQSLTIQQINEYCKNLFVFKNIRVMRFT